ncbi:bifunctional DNA-formamidopyrimidine glycosylase/DNA-(apurinic or apyrimidinic site) lyase [Methylophilaceae bacterium]|jgi:formamidopyrimidine-DNA glycosylase|nr:bifunctional DNA-formamidopyrimidine glycosylase/DNA-(apurinic or apyrimidinic site) lyase [Methylophilaceae bacterium]|tara:strand:- start:6773 stop:7588 length:816 start_codon:yes stop_codon:yes gene_type:complete
MPELPEVEVTRIGLKPLLKKDIEKVVIRNYSLRWPINSGLPELLKNQTLLDLSRRGKYILAKFNSGTLIIHLGMSGRLCIVSADEVLNKHDHVDIQFKQNNLILRYRDPRRFGSILWTEKDPYNHKLIKNLGPEPLNEEFDAKYLFSRLRNKQQCIKNAIMDSHMVVGVGNIYASEALYAAGIRPHRISKKVSMKEVSGLVKSIKNVIKEAIIKGGSTMNDFFDVNGENGYFQNEHKVYGRENELCFECQLPIIQLRLGQRSSFFCKKCQR